jgi:hypothetical protein
MGYLHWDWEKEPKAGRVNGQHRSSALPRFIDLPAWRDRHSGHEPSAPRAVAYLAFGSRHGLPAVVLHEVPQLKEQSLFTFPRCGKTTPAVRDLRQPVSLTA